MAIAHFSGWNNTDLLWSFWITSLVVGYVSIFQTSVAPLSLLIKLNPIKEIIKKFSELPTADKLKSIIFTVIFIPFSLFMFLFLSVHFLIFHLFLAYFLQIGYPHSSLTEILLHSTSGQFYTSIEIILTILFSYWIIVLQKLILDYRYHSQNQKNQVTNYQRSGNAELFSFEGIKRPYIQAARIHITIFLLLLLDAVELNQYFIYVIIYILFFFPVAVFTKAKS
jgi:hypothetical protein